jgi:hypothetical protein
LPTTSRWRIEGRDCGSRALIADQSKGEGRSGERKMERKTQLPRPQDWLRPTWEALGEEVEEGNGERGGAMGASMAA